jgi:hypothetical protein
MNRLPFETLQAVCGYIEREDLCDFRLVCKAFAAAGESGLLSQLHLKGDKRSFENVLHISRRKNLNRHVKSITYNSVSHKPLRPAQSVGPTGPGEIKNTCTGTPYDNDEPQRTLDFRDSNDYYSYIAAAIARFPNLKAIKLLDPSPGPGYSSVPEYASSEQWISDPFDIKKLLHCFLYAVVRASVPVQQLIVEGLEWDFWNTRSASLTSRSLSHLKDLKIVIEDGFPDSYFLYEQQQMLTAFCTALNSLHALECLSLSTFNTPDHHDFTEYIDCHEIMAASFWPNLRSLRLSGVRISEDSFVTFIRRHSKLRHLSLSWARLDQGRWNSMTARLHLLSHVYEWKLEIN